MTTHVERGFGESVVFLPPLGGTAALFEAQVGEFSRDFRTIAVTLPGNGDATELDVPVEDVIRTQSKAVLGMLGDLSVRRAHVVGVGYGGAVAQQFALDHPALVRRLVLCDTWGDTTTHTPVEKALSLAVRSSALAYRLAPRAALVAAVRNSYLRWPAAGRVLAEQLQTARMVELRLQFAAYTRIRNAKALRTLTCPTLCMAGDAAPWLVALARRLAMTIPDARLEILHNAFEPSHLTQPALFNEAVRRFLSRPIG